MADMTKDYADGIERGLRAWEILDDYWAQHEDARAARVALRWDATRPNAPATVREAWNLAQWDDIFERCEDYGSPLSVWLDDALEITITGEAEPGGEWQATGVKILLTYGGPNVWLTRTFSHGGAYVELLTAWGGDEDRRGIYSLPGVTDALEAVADMVAA